MGPFLLMLNFGHYRNFDFIFQDSCGLTALHVASELGHIECARALLKHKANPDILDHDKYHAAHRYRTNISNRGGGENPQEIHDFRQFSARSYPDRIELSDLVGF